MGKLNATEMLAREWILAQSKDYIEYAGGLNQGWHGRAKFLGNVSQTEILKQSEDCIEHAGGFDQGRYGELKG